MHYQISANVRRFEPVTWWLRLLEFDKYIKLFLIFINVKLSRARCDSLWHECFSGLISIPFSTVGSILGGGVILSLNLHLKQLLRVQAFLSVFLILLSIIICVIPCGNYSSYNQWVGINVPYDEVSNSGRLKLNSQCNAGCDCTDHQFIPICGNHNRTYFSPCFAGCSVTDAGNVSLFLFSYFKLRCKPSSSEIN